MMKLDPTQIWDDAGAGITEDQLAGWESRHGVLLPKLLRTALQGRNGGKIRHNDFTIFPLEEIVRVDDHFDDDMWDNLEYDEEEFGARDQVFTFAEGLGGTDVYMLNYNAKGPKAEPAIFVFENGVGRVEKAAANLRALLTTLLNVSAGPDVDWSETKKLDEILFEDVIETDKDGYKDRTEVVLGRMGGKLIHFVHRIDPDEERYERTLVPEPLIPSDATIRRMMPDPRLPYFLELHPRKPEAVQSVESTRPLKRKKWKNVAGDGVPLYVMIDSKDRDKLRALREALLGKEWSAKLIKKDDAADAAAAGMYAMMQKMQGASTAEQEAIQSAVLGQGLKHLGKTGDRELDAMLGGFVKEIEQGPQPSDPAVVQALKDVEKMMKIRDKLDREGEKKR